MVDREDYLIPAVRYPVDDATKIQKFIFVVDFGDDCDELGQRELDTTGKDSVEGGRLRIEWTVCLCIYELIILVFGISQSNSCPGMKFPDSLMLSPHSPP